MSRKTELVRLEKLIKEFTRFTKEYPGSTAYEVALHKLEHDRIELVNKIGGKKA